MERSFRLGSHAVMDLKDALATNLRRARSASGLTQEELAERAQLSARYVGAIERATVAPSVTVLGRLAQGLGIDPCDLIRTPARQRNRRTPASTGGS